MLIEERPRTRARRRAQARPRSGGSDGNSRLTALTAAVLLVLLAGEGATLLSLQTLLSWHIFVGMLLVPIVGLKLASTGHRFLRYYTRRAEYVLAGRRRRRCGCSARSSCSRRSASSRPAWRSPSSARGRPTCSGCTRRASRSGSRR
ncbi:MAG TPA: hypothetical protein VIU44_12185 [Gaiellaceae bacterium]